MKNKAKRIVSVFLALVMVAAALPMTALNAFAETSGDFEYEIISKADKTCEITNYTGSAAVLEIPSALGGYTVTSIGWGSFEKCTLLTSITIPDSVTSIGYYAFKGCTSLTSITIPDSVTSIGGSAFYGCTSLTNITIPDGVTSVRIYAFKGCTSLTSITIPDSVTSIGEDAFLGTAYYNDLRNWENDVLYIGKHFIKAKETLSGAYTIKAGTKTIAEGAFSNCTVLSSVTIPDSVTSIGDATFYGCTSLASITIPDSVTSIEQWAFENTAYYNDAGNWKNDVLYIEKHFIKAKETLSGAYAIKAGTKTIAAGAFGDCAALTGITIPDSVTSIGLWAFSNCTSLTSITIPDSVTSIEGFTFNDCTSLASVTIPDSVTSVEHSAFYGCTSLASITIPDSVTSIGLQAFYNCTALASITIPDSVKNIEDRAFGYYYSQDYNVTKMDGFTIYGNVGTAAEAYASENGFTFVGHGMQIIVNNTNLTYYVGDYIYVAVCEKKNNVNTLPEKLSVKVSDSSVIKVNGIYLSDYNDLPSQLKEMEDSQQYKFIKLEALSVGAAMVSITNSETGQDRIIPISVCKDEVAELRANNMPTKTYKCGFETDYFNAYSDGIWISEFAYEKASDSDDWIFSMNLYNENYCCGVVEVYNADGKLVDVRDVGKFESLTKGIFKTFEAGYTLVEDCFQGDAFSFRSDITAKHTRIENLRVPQDGYIIVTADVSVSSVCAVNNGFDLVFTGISLADDVKGLIKGIDNLSEDNIKQIKAAAFAKLVAQEEYLKFADKYQEKIIKKAKENIVPDMINEFTRVGILDLEELLNDMDWSLDGLLKTALGTGVGIAEDLFEKCAGPFGLVLKGMFVYQDVRDFIYEVNDLGKRITGNSKFGCYTPVAESTSGVIRNEHVTVDTNDNVPHETVLQSYRIINPDNTIVVLNDSCAYNEYQLYEIALYCDGVTIQPDGTVKVYIDCPYEKAIVARENEDGTLEYIECKIENGMVVFEVDHFCRFTIINEESEVNLSFGDVNGDNKVNAVDARFVLQASSGARTLSEAQKAAADVNKDGKVNAVDARWILQIASGARTL